MSHFSTYGAYVVFVTIRTHFESPSFDFFKHHKVKAGRQALDKRSDKWFFDKVAKQYQDKDLRDFFIANRLMDRNYVTELLDGEAEENYIRYKARRQSLTYTFTNELDRVFKHGVKKPFEISEDMYPYIVTLYLRGLISPETMVILNDFIPFFEKFDKHLGTDDLIWSKIALKLRKYKPFLKYDKDKYKSILKGKLNEQREASEKVSAEG